MSNLEPDYRGMGLTSDTLYKPELAMKFWSQYPIELFLQVMTHEIREEISKIHTLTNLISTDPKVAEITLETLAHGKTVKDTCEMIMNCNTRMEEMLNIVWEYSKIYTSKDAK
jgi:hypothetical protein